MLSWRTKNPDSFVGLGLHRDGLSVAVAARRGDAITIEQLVHRPAVGPEEQARALRDLAAEFRLKGLPAVAVLEPTAYQLLQVERPEAVPDEELAEAVRWRVKDMVDYPIGDAVLDVVPLPAGRRVDGPQFVYVVAVPASVVQAGVDLIEEASLALQAIDITELAVRNLAVLDSVEDRASAIVYLDPHVGLIEVVRNGQLFFSRRLGLHGQMLESGAPGSEQALDDLALEVQRSLDYFESQYGQGSADHVRLVGASDVINQGFLSKAAGFLTVPVRGLDEDSRLQIPEAIDRVSVFRYGPAVGGSLRNLVQAT